MQAYLTWPGHHDIITNNPKTLETGGYVDPCREREACKTEKKQGVFFLIREDDLINWESIPKKMNCTSIMYHFQSAQVVPNPKASVLGLH